MIKAFFWLLVTIIILFLVTSGLGFWKVYELVGLYWFLGVCSCYVIIITATSIIGWKLADKIATELKSFLKKVKDGIQKVIDKIKPFASKIEKILKFLGIKK